MDRTTTAPKQVTCPPSSVADQIIPCSEVQPGDLALWESELRLVEESRPWGIQGLWILRFSGEAALRFVPLSGYVAVRRYTEGTEGVALTKGERSLILALIDYAGGAIGRQDCEALRAKLEAEG